MRQVWIARAGPPEVLEVREAPDPQPGPGQVRIRVAAAGVNFADILARLGLYPDAPPLPTVVGYEVAGTVDAVGPDVNTSAPGERVLALTRFGGYSDVVVVAAPQVFPIPSSLSFEQAATLPVNYLTAWIMLVHLGNVGAGQRVLVHSVGGGVGQAALQICRWRGAEVIGTASAAKHERLRAEGVAHVIDYTRGDFVPEVTRVTAGHGVDLVLDAVGGSSFHRSYRCLAPLGRLFCYGVSSFAPGKRRSLLATLRGLAGMGAFFPLGLMNRNRGVIGLNVGHLWSEARLLRSFMEDIVKLAAEGVFHPVTDRSFAFDEASAAHAWIQDRKNFGKVLLVP